jgi:GT2 family glycosyltransferase
MKVALIVLTWNAADVAITCLDTVMHQSRRPDYIVVVDNASEDDTVARIQQRYRDILLLCNEQNLGFSEGMNTGIRALQELPEPPDLVLLLNQDTVLDPTWVEEITKPFQNDSEVGAVGSKILYSDGMIQHAGAYLEWPRAVAQHIGWHEPDHGQYDDPRPIEYVTGAAIALSMQALNTVGLFDPGYAPAYYEDTDLYWRLRRRNYQILYWPKATLKHHESLSIRDETKRSSFYNRGRLRFVLKTYRLEDILGPFADSEHAFIAQHGHTVEARALRWAYFQTILHLDDILQVRSEFHPPLSNAQKHELRQMLLGFKQALTTSLYRRARATIDTIHNL